MADINKTALLILKADHTAFLANRKMRDGMLSQWLMPGGKIEEGETFEESLVREIREELSCELDPSSLEPIAEYEAPAAGQPGKTVNIKLYSGVIQGEPVPTNEIVAIGWLGKKDHENREVSEIIREKIIPDLVRRNLLINSST